jgi:hypothetical protein
MELATFISDFNGAPLDLHEIAEEAIKIEDDDELVDLAEEFLRVKSEFEEALQNAGIEIG